VPRWARFLSCALTGALLLPAGVVAAAWFAAGGPRFWRPLLESLFTPELRGLLFLTACSSALIVLLGRLLVNTRGLAPAAAGVASGGLCAGVTVAFLLAGQAARWGGWSGLLHRTYPDVILYAVPFLLTGMVCAWLWDRLG
jgi:hypothetical protein